MNQNSSRHSIFVSACVLALAVPAVHAFAQTKPTKTTSPKTAPKTVSTAAVTPQGVTGTDPKPILWPPSVNMSSSIK